MTSPSAPIAETDLTASSGPLSALKRLVANWDRFWFSPADPTLLGLMRVGAGIVMLYVHLSYCYDLMSFVHPDKAWLDGRTSTWVRQDMPIRAFGPQWSPQPEEIARGQYTWSIYFHLHDDRAIWAAHFTVLGIIVLFTLGICTRLTSVLAWAAGICYVQRIPTQVFGMDTMQTILLTYLMIGPCGAALSVDRWWYLWRERRKRQQPDWSPPPTPLVSANLAMRLIQVHFCFIYMAAGTSKLLGPAWWNGTALWRCLVNFAFAPMDVPGYMFGLRLLVENRLVWEIVLSSMAVFTLFLEIGFPILVWQKSWRWFMVTGSILLHTGIGVLMGLVDFSLYMMLLVLAFVPPEAAHWLLGSVGGLFRAARTGAPKAAPARSDALALSR